MRFSSHLAQMVLVDPGVAAQEGFRGCQAGVAQGYISPEGWVTPCVMLPIFVGNVHMQLFSVIWDTSEVIQTLRDRSQLRVRCISCPFLYRCGGCRGVAFSYTGDYLADDPHCWHALSGPYHPNPDKDSMAILRQTGEEDV